MAKYKLIISYDGTDYCGWQIQTNEPKDSIQALIQRAIQQAFGNKDEKIHVIGSGRTDAKVHALGQVAHFSTERQFDAHKLLHSLNCILPGDIRILSLQQVDDNFHARYDAIGKEYHYHICLGKTQSPFRKKYSWHVYRELNLSLIEEALPYFIGTKDFKSFAHQASQGSAAKNSIRTIKRLELKKESHGIKFEFEGDGFLHKMVRNITGTLIDIGTKKIAKVSDLETIFASKDRRTVGNTAPAHGLFLVKVFYHSTNTETLTGSKTFAH